MDSEGIKEILYGKPKRKLLLLSVVLGIFIYCIGWYKDYLTTLLVKPIHLTEGKVGEEFLSDQRFVIGDLKRLPVYYVGYDIMWQYLEKGKMVGEEKGNSMYYTCINNRIVLCKYPDDSEHPKEILIGRKYMCYLDVALEYGFSSHANFTRVFKEVYGITPDEYRTMNVHLNQFVKPELVLNYVMVDEDMPLVTEGMVIEVMHRQLKQPRTFVGLTREVPIAELMGGTDTSISVTAQLWDEFHKVKEKVTGLIQGGNEFGALYMGDAKADIVPIWQEPKHNMV